MKQKIRLTKSEREIMDVLWKQGKALTSSEIIEFSTNRSWSNTSIHLLLKSLLDKRYTVNHAYHDIPSSL